MPNIFKKSFWQAGSFVLLLCMYFVLLAHPIDLSSSDLGRHLTNGQQILHRNFSVLYSNFYSYSLPSQKFINHHWFTGVLFFLIDQFFGSAGLQIFHSGILLIGFSFLHDLMKKLGSWQIANALSLLAIIFLSERLEIRPESFGYLFLSITLWICWKILRAGKISWKQIFWLIFQQILWVNLHISFIFGWMSIGILLISSLQKSKPSARNFQYRFLWLFLGMIGVSLINPNFFNGLMAPFSVFSNYGYRVVENQTLWFLHSRISNPTIALYFLLAPVVAGLLLFTRFSPHLKRKKMPLFWEMCAWVGVLLGFLALRNIPIFVLLSFPFLSSVFHTVLSSIKRALKIKDAEKKFLLVWLFFFICFVLLVLSGKYRPSFHWKNRQLGVPQSQTASIENLKRVLHENHITGNILNNYDVGSFLIYSLYPEYRVFVDNRPEAYSEDFFKKIYIPLQENENVWQTELERNNFQAIVWGYRDITPWSQVFIESRLSDPLWHIAYQDERIIVLIKDAK